MFQHFDLPSQRDAVAARVASLRQAMAERNIDAFLVPHSDEQQNEYLPPNAERLAWLTGFTGSAGFAIVTAETAVLFVDGRYTIQAARQTDTDCFSIESLVDNPPQRWIRENAKSAWRIGYDPALFTMAGEEQFLKSAEKAGAVLADCGNLVDAVWHDRPPAPAGPVSIQELEHAGKPAIQKLDDLSAALAEKDARFCLLTDPASVAWAFNIRGSDIAHIPVPLSWAVLRRGERPLLFVDAAKLDRHVRAYLTQLADLHEPSELDAELAGLGAGARVLCDPERVPARVGRLVKEAGGEIVRGRDPVALPRAIKNPSEIRGSRAAHLRDGVAMVRFLAWLDRQKPGTVSEIEAASKLEEIRSGNARHLGSRLEDISFDTISGAGPNGAIVHYRVTKETDSVIGPDSVYLVDSGAQYRDGTTDITRTVAIGSPPARAREDFTLVLKGHIAIATARFPKGTRGVDLDPLARIALWRSGRDFAHGTGHGIGSFLSVHEGPQSISRRGMEPLQAGMILSNEPGFYRQDHWGIRIENLVLVREAQATEGGNVEVHDFETLTLAPIDTRLVEPGMLTAEEAAWLDGYHARVLSDLSPLLSGHDRHWLEKACASLGTVAV